jgi:hypothetical protein
MNIYTRLNPNIIPFVDAILERGQTTFTVQLWNTEKLGASPSEQQLKELFDETASYYADYAKKRRIEYPPIEDYIDGVVKGDQSQIQDYIDRCLAVKQKYPKP